jgi:hypothetical protein
LFTEKTPQEGLEITTALALALPTTLGTLGGGLAVTGQSLLAVSGQILVATNIGHGVDVARERDRTGVVLTMTDPESVFLLNLTPP